MEIYTLGGGETLIDVLNAIALIVGSSDWAALVKISFMVSLAVVAIMSITGNPFWSYAKQFGILLMMYWGLFLPTATVTVTDRLEPALAGNTVANVPWGLAFFASSASRIGDSFTTISETVFSLPSDLNYQENGFIFGSALMEKITTARINNGSFKSSIHSFAAECIFYEINVGTYTWEELRTSEDIWEFVTVDNAPSPASAFEYTNPTTGATSIETCATGAGYLTAYWTTETDNAISKIGRQLRPRLSTADANTEILAALPIATDYMIGLSETAANTMRQAMMIQGLKGGMQEYAANADATSAVIAANQERAALQTAMAQQLAGRQAQTFVPLLRTIFEIIFYAMFPFTIIMLVLPQTVAGLKSYFALFVGLQMWGPMFVVLHRLMMSQASTSTMAAAAIAGGGDGLTYATMGDMSVVQTEIANLAGYLSLSVPFLAGAFGFGSAKLGSLATSTLSSFQRASDQVAAQASHGQLQLGTTSQGVHAFNNMTGNRVLTSGSYDTTQTSMRMGSGAVRSIAGDGSIATDTTQMGSRSGHHNFRASEAIASSLNQAASVQHSEGQSERSQATDSQVAGLSKMLQSISSNNASVANTQSMTERQSASRREAIEQAEAVTNNISEQLGVDNSLAGSIVAYGALEGSFDSSRIPGPISKIAEFAGAELKGSLGLRADASAKQVAKELFNVGKDATQSLRETGSLDNLVQYAQDGSLSFTDGQSQSLNNQINADFAKSRQHSEMAEAHFANERSLSEQANLQESRALSGEFNQNDELINYMAQQVSPRVNGSAPMGKSAAFSLFESQNSDDQALVRDYAKNFQQEKSDAIIAETVGQFRKDNGLENTGTLRSSYEDARSNISSYAPSGNAVGNETVLESAGDLAGREIDTSLQERTLHGRDAISGEMTTASSHLNKTRSSEVEKVKDEVATSPMQMLSDPFDTGKYLAGVTDNPGGEIGEDFETNILNTKTPGQSSTNVQTQNTTSGTGNSTSANTGVAPEGIVSPTAESSVSSDGHAQSIESPSRVTAQENGEPAAINTAAAEKAVSGAGVTNQNLEGSSRDTAQENARETSNTGTYRDVGLPVTEYVPDLSDTDISRNQFVPGDKPQSQDTFGASPEDSVSNESLAKDNQFTIPAPTFDTDATRIDTNTPDNPQSGVGGVNIPQGHSDVGNIAPPSHSDLDSEQFSSGEQQKASAQSANISPENIEQAASTVPAREHSNGVEAGVQSIEGPSAVAAPENVDIHSTPTSQGNIEPEPVSRTSNETSTVLADQTVSHHENGGTKEDEFGNWLKNPAGNTGLSSKDLDINQGSSSATDKSDKVPQAPQRNASNN